MFVTNLRTKTMYVNYRNGALVKSQLIRGNTQVEITDLTAITQIIFNSYDQRLRDLKAKFPNRGILGVVELLELRTTQSGALI